jgi:hypothetical protein
MWQNDDNRTALGARTTVVCGVLVAMGLGALIVAGVLGRPTNKLDDSLARFSASYLVSYAYYLSISLGALFFVVLQHLVRAGWSVAVRRLAEILAANLLWWPLLFLPLLVPVLMGKSQIYVWANPGAVAGDALLQWKSPYLNGPFFAARAVGYFVVWALLARFYFATSVRQDVSGDPELTRRMEKFSPVALILFGLTVTFAAFDWLMSLDPKWFSTIYGLYYFSGCAVAAVAALILLAMAVQGRGQAVREITTEHYHDLGKLLLGFIVFWGYMAFSQYMLIWYANIPEETVWYLTRQTGFWVWVTLALLFGHLLIPFLGLLSREMKRRKALLGFWAAWMLVVHWVDLYWLVMPGLFPERPPFGIMDVCCIVGLGCLFVAGIVRTAGRCSPVAMKDPRLGESVGFGNF